MFRRMAIVVVAGTLAGVAFAGSLASIGQAGYATTACARSAQVVIVDLDNRKHIHILRHVWAAIKRGHAAILHIDRVGADQNREEATGHYPTRPGYDRDEYPPAIAREGGKGADIRYVKSGENRSAGASMGNQLRSYCNGQAFRFEAR